MGIDNPSTRAYNKVYQTIHFCICQTSEEEGAPDAEDHTSISLLLTWRSIPKRKDNDSALSGPYCRYFLSHAPAWDFSFSWNGENV